MMNCIPTNALVVECGTSGTNRIMKISASEMTRVCLVALLALSLTACAPTLPPEVGYAAYIAQMTGTSNAAIAQSTQAIATQSADEYQYAKLKTEQARPAMETGTAIAISTQQIGLDLAKTRAAYEVLSYANSYTATMAALEILESDTQKRIAENNRSIADSVHGGELWRSTKGFLVGLVVLGFGVVVAWLVIQLCAYALTRRNIAETKAKWDAVFEQEHKMFQTGVFITSGGQTAVTLAEKHVAAYQDRNDKASKWRGMLKAYTNVCIELGREGVKHPFSRPTCAEYALLTRPDRAEWWQLGHKRAIGLLFDMGILTNDTGQGGEVVLAIDSGSVSRVIDTTPLPELPPDPIPVAKITLATSQV